MRKTQKQNARSKYKPLITAFACHETQSAKEPEQYMSDFSNLDLFFKKIRIQILYGKGNDYVRVKLRTLLKHYGYKRRSQLLIQHINRCLYFYHLEITVRGGIPCLIEDATLDQMLIFHVV